MSSLNIMALKAALAVAGVFALFSGLDQALGGLLTLGWMGQTPFFEIVDQRAFEIADNHQRFLGGVWTGLGLALLVGLRQLRRYTLVFQVLFGMVFLGGLARLSQMNFQVLFSADIVAALFVELVGMPILFFWLSGYAKHAPSGQMRI